MLNRKLKNNICYECEKITLTVIEFGYDVFNILY
jgi:hypothetical protein